MLNVTHFTLRRFPIPLDHFLQGLPQLNAGLLREHFGDVAFNSPVDLTEEIPEELKEKLLPQVDIITEPLPTTLQYIYRWGREDPEGPDFTWVRFVSRTLVDAVIMGILSLLAAKAVEWYKYKI